MSDRIGSYQRHGAQGDTDNQLRSPSVALEWFLIALIALIVGEIGGFAILLAGFVHSWA